MYAVRNIRVQLIVHFFMNGTQHRGNEKETLKGAMSRITHLEKAGKFFQVCHS